MEITNQDLKCFLDWKIKTRDLKENISQLESREMKAVMAYYSIMQNACTQFAGFVAASSFIGLFRELTHFLVLGMGVTYILYLLYPLYFGSKKMQRLEFSSREVIAERKRLYRSCISLMSEYNNMCDVVSPSKDTQEDLVFKELGDVVMKKIKNFKKEEAKLVYQTKYYHNFLLLTGVLGLIYAIVFISAFYVIFQDVPKDVPKMVFQLSQNESVVLPTAAVKRLLLRHIQ